MILFRICGGKIVFGHGDSDRTRRNEQKSVCPGGGCKSALAEYAVFVENLEADADQDAAPNTSARLPTMAALASIFPAHTPVP